MPVHPILGQVPNVRVAGDLETGFKLVVDIDQGGGGGGYTVPTSTMVYDQQIVQTSDIEIVGTNTNRVSLRIFNSHATGTVWLNFNNETATVNLSYPLLAQKEYVYDSSYNGRFTGAVRAVVAPATSLATLHILEETAA